MSSERTRQTRSKAESSTAETTRTMNASTFETRVDEGTARASFAVEKIKDLFGFAGRIFHSARVWIWETVTKLGWVAFTLVLLWVPLGVVLGWPEFVFLGIVSTAILVVAIPFLIGGKSYEIGFTLKDDHMVAGIPEPAPISVTNTNNRMELPGVLEVQIGSGIEEFAIPLLRAGETKNIDYEIPANPRGVLKIGPITTVRTDPIGVLRKENRLVEAREIFVYPETRILPPTVIGYMRDLEGNPTLAVVESDLTFHSIREYVPGDNPKHIHWKATAKIGKEGKFLVRQYAESRRSRMVVISDLDPASYLADSNEFEVAVSAVGSLGTRAIMDNRGVSVVMSAEIAQLERKKKRAIRQLHVETRKRLLQDLCTINPHAETMQLIDVCRMATQQFNDMSLAIIVTGSNVETRQMQRIRQVLPNNIGVAFVQANARSDSKPKFFRASTIDVLNIQEIQDLPGLLGRYRG